MQVQEAKKQIQLQMWANQIKSCQQSGQSVKEWCRINGVNEKTYYYRLKKVREEMLEQMTQRTQAASNPLTQNKEPINRELAAQPIFAPLSMLNTEEQQEPPASEFRIIHEEKKPSPITVRIGRHLIEINNNAEAVLIEQVLKVAAQV